MRLLLDQSDDNGASSNAVIGPEYRGAIALNNIGVDLLERKAYQQGLVTLTDATKVIKQALSMASPGDPTAYRKLDIDGMIERANRRRSRPSPMERQASYRMLNLADNHSHLLEQDDPKKNNDGELLETIYPIRIEDSSPDLLCPGNFMHDSDAQSSMILHNLALSYLCVGRLSLHDKERKINYAVVLFGLSNTILERHGESAKDFFKMRQISCLNIAVLSGLLSTLGSDSTERSKALQTRIGSLRSTVELLDASLDKLFLRASSAGAA